MARFGAGEGEDEATASAQAAQLLRRRQGQVPVGNSENRSAIGRARRSARGIFRVDALGWAGPHRQGIEGVRDLLDERRIRIRLLVSDPFWANFGGASTRRKTSRCSMAAGSMLLCRRGGRAGLEGFEKRGRIRD